MYLVVANDKPILNNDNIQKQRLQNLLKIYYVLSDSHNLERVIFDFVLF